MRECQGKGRAIQKTQFHREFAARVVVEVVVKWGRFLHSPVVPGRDHCRTASFKHTAARAWASISVRRMSNGAGAGCRGHVVEPRKAVTIEPCGLVRDHRRMPSTSPCSFRIGAPAFPGNIRIAISSEPRQRILRLRPRFQSLN